MDEHPERLVTDMQVDALFSQTYKQSATMTTAENGFAASGVLP